MCAKCDIECCVWVAGLCCLSVSCFSCACFEPTLTATFIYPLFLQQYMMKVQEQKHGTAGGSLGFLDEPSKKPAAMQADDDMGFDEMQMRILEDTEQVREGVSE